MKKIKLFSLALLVVLFALAIAACDTSRPSNGGNGEDKPGINDGVNGDKEPQHVHTVVENPYVAPTCTESGLSSGSYCSECGEVLVEQQYISPLGHTVVIDEGVEPTCTQPGLSSGSHCSVCGEILSEKTTIEATGHYLSYYSEKDPTCQEVGYYAYEKCNACDYTTYVERPIVDHLAGEVIIDVYPALGVEGKQHTECVFCGKIMSEETIEAATASVGLSYYTDELGAYISGIGSCEDKNVIIPETIDGISVVGIRNNAFYNCTQIESIVIPDSVKSIGECAFLYCSSLQNIVLPSGLESIEYNTFAGCASLKSIVIPESVKSIGESAFSDCASLEEITIPDALQSIGDNAFGSCTSLTTVTIPDTVTSLGKSLFSHCSSLESVTLPFYANNVICDGEYNAPESLKTIIFTGAGNSTNQEIGAEQFKNFKSLETVVLPDDITSIGDYAFYGCTNLTSLSLPSSLTHIGEYVFNECSALSYTTYDNAIYLGNDENPYIALVKASNESITSCVISDSTRIICNNAFAYCSLLESISLPEGLESIGSSAFESCDKLISISLPEGLKNIGSSAFRYCYRLSSISLPEGLESISEKTFEGCSSLKSINIPKSIKTIASDSFKNTALSYVNIVDIAAWCNIKFEDEAASPLYSGKTDLYLNGDVITYLSIPNGVTTISAYALSSPSILWVSLPKSIVSIQDNAFAGCNKLVEIANASKLTISAGSTGNGGIAANAVHVYDPETEESSIEIINGFVFCTADDKSYLLSYVGNDKELVLPETYNESPYYILQYAFANLTDIFSVTMPKNIMGIGKAIFSDCTSLESITIPYLGSSADDTSSTLALGYLFGEYSYSGYNSNVPESLNYVKVLSGTNISAASFRDCKFITEISLPDEVVEIEEKAFYNCSALTTVNIPEGVTSIKDGTFANCTSIVSITLPKTLESIGNNAFANCSSLTSIVIPDSVVYVGTYIFNGCTSIESISLPFIGDKRDEPTVTFFGYLFGTSKTDNDATVVPESLKSVTITSATAIPQNAFYKCAGIESIVLPETLTSIGNCAFMQCTGITEISLPESLQSIGNASFSGCTAIQSIHVPEGVRSIGNNCFQGCSKLTEITFEGGLQSIGWTAFRNCSALTSIHLPASVQTVGNGLFEGCTKLESITIPYIGNSVDGSTQTNITLGYYFGAISSDVSNKLVPESLKSVKVTGGGLVGINAFYNCQNIEKIELCGTITKIGNSAFDSCTALKEIILPTALEELHANAFRNCTALTSVALPEGLKSIGNYAFYKCTSLTIETIPSTILHVGTEAFEGCNMKMTTDETGSYIGSAQNPYLVLVKVNNTDITSFTFKEQTKVIYFAAFADCKKLTSITIPETITSIGTSAFANTGLVSIEIPATVKYLGESVFLNCESLVNATLPEGITTIPRIFFYGCSSLSTFTVPSTVTTIEDFAFENCYRLYEIINKSALNISRNSTSHGGIGTNALCIRKPGEASNFKTTSDGFMFAEYRLTGGTTYFLIGYTGTERDITLPDYYNGHSYYIYQNAFRGNKQIRSVRLGKGVTSIGSYAFAYCPYLYKVTAPTDAELTTIGDYAFLCCGNLASLTLPKSLTSLGGSALDGCYCLVEVCNDSKISNDDIYYGHYGSIDYNLMNKYTSTSGSSKVYLENGYLFYSQSKDYPLLLGYIYPDKDLVLPELSDGKTYRIINRAFFRTDIESVKFSKSVGSIGQWAFAECEELRSITFVDNGALVNIEMAAFQLCTKLDNVKLPEGLEYTGWYSFNHCDGLTTIYIPHSFTHLTSASFANCALLTTVYYNGTMEEWKNITRVNNTPGGDWDNNSGEYTVVCTDGTLGSDK